MTREAIGVGETELEALNDAKRQLGLSETDDVEFELIQRAEKKNSDFSAALRQRLRLLYKKSLNPKWAQRNF